MLRVDGGQRSFGSPLTLAAWVVLGLLREGVRQAGQSRKRKVTPRLSQAVDLSPAEGYRPKAARDAV